MRRKLLSLGLRAKRTINAAQLFGGCVRGSIISDNKCVALGLLETRTRWITTMGCSTSKMEVKESSSKKEDYVEGVVCQDSDILENEMKAFDLEDVGKVLLVRQNGKLTAVGSKCTHYGAPLETGALGNGRVRCPWHGACFNITTGDIEDFPGLDSLPCYQVEVVDNGVKVRARRSDLESNKRSKSMCPMDSQNNQHVVVIGGGPSAATCVETLRQEGFAGKITMIAKENCLPYDRVKVSKSMDVDITSIELRNDDFYKKHNITVMKNAEAISVNTKTNQVGLKDGSKLDYSQLYIATGSTPAKAPVPGADLENVFVLRDYDDAKKVLKQLGKDKEIVVLGASFIALEAASYCVSKVKKVTVIGRDFVPFRSLLGPEVGGAVKKLFEDKGIVFQMNNGMKACIGENKVEFVDLISGDRIKADAVIMGTGSTLNTDFLKSSGLSIMPSGAIEVNEYMQSNVDNVYVGGDIAHAPVYSNDNEKSTIGHYPLAHYHGRIAALNILNKTTPAKAVPYFWTMLFGKGIRYAGHGRYEEILYTGNVAELKFVAFYLKGDRVIAVSSCGMDPNVSKYAELRAQGKNLYRQDLGENLLGWTK